MADDPTTDTAGDDKTEARPAPPAARPAPRPSPASRARRIGGATRPAAPPTPPPTAPPTAPPPTAGLNAPAGAPAEATAAPGDDPDAEDAEGVEAGEAKPEVPVWLTWAPAAILVAGAVAMAIIVSIVSHGVWWGNDTASARSVTALRQQVSAAAKTCLAATNTYKYTDIDAFEKAGSDCTTGTQTTQFRKAVDTLIRKNAPKLKFSQTAQINKAAIESVSGNQWTILLYGQLAVTNTTTPNGRTDPFAAVVRMEKVHGRWLISSLRTVSSPVN